MSDEYEAKYYIYFKHDSREWRGASVHTLQELDVIYFKTEEQLEEALELANRGYRDLFTVK